MSRLPAPGERVKIYWPQGPYDFVIQYSGIDDGMPAPQMGWLWMRGLVVEPAGVEHRAMRTFLVHRVDGHFEMLAKTS